MKTKFCLGANNTVYVKHIYEDGSIQRVKLRSFPTEEEALEYMDHMFSCISVS